MMASVLPPSVFFKSKNLATHHGLTTATMTSKRLRPVVGSKAEPSTLWTPSFSLSLCRSLATANRRKVTMGGAGTAIIVTNAALSASKIIAEAVQDWSSYTPEFIQRDHFGRMIENNTVIGFHEHLRLARYAPTPILDAMCNCRGKSKVFVAMAPSALGKTTAAKEFLHHFKKDRQGIAICVQSAATNTPYVQLMLSALGFSPTNPPKGWLKCLVSALHNAGKRVPGKPYRKPFLILDDFGGTDTDAELVMALKSQVRNTNASVIILTRNQKDADFLLEQNTLQGIIPLADTYPNFRELYPHGEWVSMSWGVETYKMSARHQPSLVQFSRDQIDDAIDEIFRGLSQEGLKQLTPLVMWDKLEAHLSPEILATAPPRNTFSGKGDEKVGCVQCIVS